MYNNSLPAYIPLLPPVRHFQISSSSKYAPTSFVRPLPARLERCMTRANTKNPTSTLSPCASRRSHSGYSNTLHPQRSTMDRRDNPRDRDPQSRYDTTRARSRSPARRDNRNEDGGRRRERSPFRGGRGGRGGGGRGRGRGGGAGYDREGYRGREEDIRSGGDRDRDADGDRDGRRGSHSPPPPPRGPRQQGPGGTTYGNNRRLQQAPRKTQQQQPQVKWELLDGETEEDMMARIMGFGKFRSTKNTKVPGNDRNYAVRKVKKAEYRQYMNRVGGFNRPLSPGRG